MLDADVYIAKMPKADIIKQYYSRCGYEMAGPNFMVKANEPQTITSLEDLADKMLKSTAWVQLVVCHGDPTLGLLLPLVKGAPHNKTGASEGHHSRFCVARVVAKVQMSPTVWTICHWRHNASRP
jgi:hypothetical protein